ncbi:MAG: hypothetical protein ACOYOP_07675 [Microthrixaceae bacterium]
MADDGEPRTFSIWLFLAAFVVIGALGLAALLLLGGPSTPTVQLPTRQTTTSSTVPSPTVAGGGPVPTVPGGAPAPEGVQSVVVDGDATSYAFTVPEDLTRVAVRAVVAPAEAVPTPDGRSLTVTVRCGAATGEVLAQLTVTEGDTTVGVLPVVLAPTGAPACAPEAAPRVATVPLAEPLAARTVVVAPAGTEVPIPATR